MQTAIEIVVGNKYRRSVFARMLTRVRPSEFIRFTLVIIALDESPKMNTSNVQVFIRKHNIKNIPPSAVLLHLYGRL